MKYERLKNLDKKTLINLNLMKDERLDVLDERFNRLEKLGKLFIDNKSYWIYREKINKS